MKRCILLGALAVSACSFPTGEFRLGDAGRDAPALADRGAADTGPDDSGPADSGPADTSPVDSGPVDTGADDSAPVDAGAEDATDAPPDDAPPADATDAPPADVTVADVTDVTIADAGCPAGQVVCADTCVSTDTNPQHCGRCGNQCDSTNGIATCAAGSCAITCTAGFGDCNARASDGCEAPLTTSANCEACGRTCGGANASATCATGACVLTCNAGFANCDGDDANGCEASTNTIMNCGSCGRACNAVNGTPGCSGGSCTIACGSGFANCDGDVANGCEAPLNTNANCGACMRPCASGTTCNGASCTTVCTMTTCTGACVDLATNPANCGACGRTCSLANATPTCRAGACAVGTCSSGFADCDAAPANGCEVSLGGDASNCGVCGRRCVFPNASATCSAGACALGACLAGFANCDGVASNGCEVNLNADVANCGRCGNYCRTHVGGSNACTAGACVPTCNPGYGNCDRNPSNGCEAQFGTNAACGGCGRTCAAACQNTAGLCGGVSPGSYRSLLFTFPPPAFIDVCSIPGRTTFLPTTDDGSMLVPLPFAFRYFANSYVAGTRVNVTTNGWISLDAVAQSQYYSMIPDSTAPNSVIAPFFTDLITGPLGVCVATTGAAPNRRFMVEWPAAAYLSDRTRLLTFEAILAEGLNQISFYYDVMSAPPPGQSVNVGLESPGGVAATVYCSAPNACTLPSNTRLAYGM